MFDAEPIAAMLKVITALEAKQQLSKEQSQGFCRQLQGHFLELDSAFRGLERS